MGLIGVFSKIFGFFREVALSYFFGANEVTDAFVISNTIPNMIFSFIASGLVYSFIPVYNEIKSTHGTNRANIFTIKLVNLLVLLASLMCFFLFLFTQDVVQILAMGFKDETLKMAIEFTRISVFAIYGLIFINIITAILQINNKFYMISLIGFPFNIIYISGIFLAYKQGAIYLPIANLIAICSQLMLLIYPLFKCDFKINFTFSIKDEYIKKLFFIAIPVIANYGVSNINLIIDKTLASSLMVGGVSILTYSWLVISSLSGLLASPILTIFFPKISHSITEKNYSTLKTQISSIATLMIVLLLPFSFGIILYSYELIDFLLNRGNFTTQNTIIASNVLKFYAISFFISNIGSIVSSVYYALKKTKLILYNAIIGIFFNICFNLILSRYIGIYGLALATSLSSIITTLLLIKSLNRYAFFDGKYLLNVFFKAFLAAIFMTICVSFFKEFVDFRYSLMDLLSGSIVGFCIYLWILYFMKINMVNENLILIKNKIKDKF